MWSLSFLDCKHGTSSAGVVGVTWPETAGGASGGPRNLPAEGTLAFALAFALGPEVAAHAAETRAALGILHLSIGSAEVTPAGAPFTPEMKTKKCIVYPHNIVSQLCLIMVNDPLILHISLMITSPTPG